MKTFNVRLWLRRAIRRARARRRLRTNSQVVMNSTVYGAVTQIRSVPPSLHRRDWPEDDDNDS